MDLPLIASPGEWQVAHERLLVKEKEATRARDALAAERRRQPMVRLDKEYVVEGPTTSCSHRASKAGRRRVSRAPLASIERFRERMGWAIPWLSSSDNDFNVDFGLTRDGDETFGLSVFLRQADDVYRTYFTSGRGVEALGAVWTFLDLTPLGRQEEWEDSPQGYPQTQPYGWWRRHDEYEDARM
jgi:predicted dithiol-disulfide oxidoreductase (DUF899 family)